MQFSVAVISDLHCQHSSAKHADSLLITDEPMLPTSQHPVAALLDLIEDNHLAAQALLMAGDLTNRVDRQGMISGWMFVRDIARALNAQLIAPTLGNHDVISRKHTDDPFQLARRLFPKFPVTTDAIFDEFWSRGFCVITVVPWRILIINSVASHNNERSAERGLMDANQLAALEIVLSHAERTPFQIALCHHHPILHEDIGLGTTDVMENGGLLVDILTRYDFSMLVHGHKHHPKLSYAGATSQLPILAAGSLSAGMGRGLATRTRNLFHMITLAREEGRPGICGTVQTWQFRHSRGWTPATWDSADFPHITGFGCHSSPDELAAGLAATFRELGKPMAMWNEVSDRVSEVRYVPPQVFEAVGTQLRTAGIELNPAPPDEPRMIGRVQ